MYITAKNSGVNGHADRTEPEENLVAAQSNLLDMYNVILVCYEGWQNKIEDETNETKKKEYCLLARRQIAELIFSVALYEAMNTRIVDVNKATVNSTSEFKDLDISYDQHFGKLLYIILKQHFGTEYLPEVVSIVENITGNFNTVDWSASDVEFQVQCRTLLCHSKPGKYLSQPGNRDGILHWQDYFQELNKTRNDPKIVESKVQEIADSNFFSDEENVAIALTTPIQYEGKCPPQPNSGEVARITSQQTAVKADDRGPKRPSSPSTVAEIGEIEKMVEGKVDDLNQDSSSITMAKTNHTLQMMASSNMILRQRMDALRSRWN